MTADLSYAQGAFLTCLTSGDVIVLLDARCGLPLKVRRRACMANNGVNIANSVSCHRCRDGQGAMADAADLMQSPAALKTRVRAWQGLSRSWSGR